MYIVFQPFEEAAFTAFSHSAQGPAGGSLTGRRRQGELLLPLLKGVALVGLLAGPLVGPLVGSLVGPPPWWAHAQGPRGRGEGLGDCWAACRHRAKVFLNALAPIRIV